MASVGERLGRFQLERLLGQGTYGAVYEALDTSLSLRVALKVLREPLGGDPLVRERFRREIVLARRIVHPGVCRVFDLHEEPNGLAISMELVRGTTLLTALEQRSLSQRQVLDVLRALCRAVQAAHDVGVIHRDLKPANIVLREGGEPVILDFGTAIADDVGRLTEPGTAIGSLRFIAPEVLRGGAVTPAADVYALGMIGYAALSGALPYAGVRDVVSLVQRMKAETPALAPSVGPLALRRAVERAIHGDVTQRYARAADFERELAQAAQPERPVASPDAVQSAPTVKVPLGPRTEEPSDTVELPARTQRIPRAAAYAQTEPSAPAESGLEGPTQPMVVAEPRDDARPAVAAASVASSPASAGSAGSAAAPALAVTMSLRAPPKVALVDPSSSFPMPAPTQSVFDARGRHLSRAIWVAIALIAIASALAVAYLR